MGFTIPADGDVYGALLEGRLRQRRPDTETLNFGVDGYSSYQGRLLLDRVFEAAAWLDARSVGISGGVSANSRLRAEAEARGARAGRPVFVPPLSLSTDNAAMIGAAGLRLHRAGVTGSLDFNADASLPLVV